MLTLSYGFKKPQTGDQGAVWFPALELNFQKLNDHTHDGSNSAKLTPLSSVVATGSAPSGSWVLVAAGTYRQLVTTPAGILFDECVISTRDATTKHYYFLQIEKVSANTFYVYINDNSKSATVVYSS